MTTVHVMSLNWSRFAPVHGPVPRYRQLAQFIRAGVESGKLRPGEPLPSETALADYCGVSVDTVRSALALLREDGVIVTSQGIGSFVAGA
jgi:DNA-binding GntR family transcriptional regulator